jgi:membrane-associated phospholipid phosphatase
MQLKLFDLLTFIYVGIVSVLIILFRFKVAGWYLYIVLHFLYVFFVLLLIWYDNTHQNRITSLFRRAYPLISFPFMYEEIGQFIHIIFPSWFDFAIHRFELWFFGVYPTVWLQRLVTPWATEYFKLAYFSYYLIVPIAALALYWKGDMRIFEEFVTVIAFVFYICYLGFMLFPVEGPRYALATLYTIKLKGYIITPLQDFLTAIGALHGGCMPSSHVAVALVSLITMRRNLKTVYYFFLPFVINLFVAAIYTRDHYVSDVIAGLLVGCLGLYLVPRVSKSLTVLR